MIAKLLILYWVFFSVLVLVHILTESGKLRTERIYYKFSVNLLTVRDHKLHCSGSTTIKIEAFFSCCN